MHEFSQLYIGGRWVDPVGTDTIDVVDASTEEVMGHIPAGTAADVDAAVTAAKGAFDGWAATSPSDRAKYVQAIAEGIGARNAEIAEVITGEVGMPQFLSQLIQAGLPQATASATYASRVRLRSSGVAARLAATPRLS